MMLDIGFMFSFGTLYVDIMATFGIGRSKAAMVQSILMAVRFGSGKEMLQIYDLNLDYLNVNSEYHG